MIISNPYTFGTGPDFWPVPALDSSGRSEKLRRLAYAMETTINYKLNPSIAQQNPTARRARIAADMARDGERLKKIQSILYGLAMLNDAGQLPPQLNIFYKSQVELLLSRYSDCSELHKIGIRSRSDWDIAQDYINRMLNPVDPVKAKIKEIELGLVGCNIPGFYPTPVEVVAKMVRSVDWSKVNSALEPGAGNGLIAQAIAEHCNNITVCEINYTLRELLSLKGFHIADHDFLDHSGKYDVILMNPPFERFQDIDHVKHAYSLLSDNPYRRLVSVMSESTFFNKKSKATEFRHWLNSVGATIEPLGSAFSKAGLDRIRTTAVKSRLVTI